MRNAECPFCRKLATREQLPDEDIVWQFPHSLAILSEWQQTLGSTTRVPAAGAEVLKALPGLSSQDRLAAFKRRGLGRLGASSEIAVQVKTLPTASLCAPAAYCDSARVKLTRPFVVVT